MQSISLTYKAELASDMMNKRIHELIGGNVILKGYNVVPGPGTRAVNITGATDNESVLFINGAKIKETATIVQTISFALNSSGSTRYDTVYAHYEYGVSSICEYRVVQGSTDAPSPNVTCKIATVAIPSGSTTVSAGNITLNTGNRISDMASLSRLASPTVSGLMTSTLFNKLSNISDKANNYTHPTSSGNKHIPSGGTSGKILGWLSDGTASWIDTPISYTHPSTSGNKHIPSGGVAGKLLGWLSDGTATWVDAPVTYTHPSSHPATIITQTASYRFVTDAEKAVWNGKANASHGTHLPALQAANNSIFLRNDNSWAYVTPANIGAAAANHSHSYLPLTGGTISGNLTVTGTIQGSKVYNAVWNDYAELFKIDDLKEEINPGDIVELNPETGDYRKSKKKNSNLVVGVVSDQYGHLLGGDYGLSEEDNLKTHAAIGLAGRVFVNVVGPVNAGDLIASSDIAGVGMSAEHYSPGCVVGKALETKKTPDIGKVKILIINR